MEAIDRKRRALVTGGAGVAAALSLPHSAMAQSVAGAGLTSEGMALLQRLGAAGSSDLAALSPDLARLHAEAVATFLDRPALSLKARMLVVVAALTVQGCSPEPLKQHLAVMLRTGWRPEQIVELAMHSLIYAGFPAAQTATLAARDVFREAGVSYQARSGRPEGDDWRLGVGQLAATGGGDALAPARQGVNDQGLAPDLDRWTVEFAHGEIWNRPALSLRDRELATLAMVIANGNAAESVRFHAEACLRTGWSRDQVVEVLVQMATLVGWPAALGAVTPMLEALRAAEGPDGLAPAGAAVAGLAAASKQRETDEARYRRGVEAMGKISRSSGEAVVAGFRDIAPDLGRYIMEFSYGEVFARPGLDLKTRELATVAALTARGATFDETPLRVHIVGALNTGASRTEIVEAILHMIPYAGFTRVQAAIRVAGEALEEAEKQS